MFSKNINKNKNIFKLIFFLEAKIKGGECKGY
jgi:hypothetical protein